MVVKSSYRGDKFVKKNDPFITALRYKTHFRTRSDDLIRKQIFLNNYDSEMVRILNEAGFPYLRRRRAQHFIQSLPALIVRYSGKTFVTAFKDNVSKYRLTNPEAKALFNAVIQLMVDEKYISDNPLSPQFLVT